MNAGDKKKWTRGRQEKEDERKIRERRREGDMIKRTRDTGKEEERKTRKNRRRRRERKAEER